MLEPPPVSLPPEPLFDPQRAVPVLVGNVEVLVGVNVIVGVGSWARILLASTLSILSPQGFGAGRPTLTWAQTVSPAPSSTEVP
jgi:hypothetical protein